MAESRSTSPTVLVTGANGQLGMELRSLAPLSRARFIFTDRTAAGEGSPAAECDPGRDKTPAGEGSPAAGCGLRSDDAPAGTAVPAASWTDCVGTDCRETLPLDVTDAEAVTRAVTQSRAQVVVNCAAYTDVERAEDDYDAAYAVNCTAAGNLARAALAAGATLIHISTDYVFGGSVPQPGIPYGCTDASAGERPDAPMQHPRPYTETDAATPQSPRPYTETDTPAPLNAYGRTKLAGERAIEDSGCKWLIFRTSGLYSPYGRNFVKTVLRLLTERDTVSVVDDQICTPTCAADLASLIVKIIDNGLYDRTGLYNFSGEGRCSWCEFALAVAELSGAPSRCRIVPCGSAEYPSKAVRPAFSVLDKTKVREAFGVAVPHWRDSLAAFFERIFRI